MRRLHEPKRRHYLNRRYQVFAPVLRPSCLCILPIGAQSTDQIVARIMLQNTGARALLTAPLSLDSGEDYPKLWERLRAQGFSRVRVNGSTYSLDEPPEISRKSLVEVDVALQF